MKLNLTERQIIDHRKQICDQLRRRREELGLSPGIVAEKTGISQASVLKIENGEWDIKFSFFTALLAALDLEIEVKPDGEINYKQLLKKYIDHVADCEGVDFISTGDGMGFFKDSFSKEEQVILIDMSCSG